jgi:hypothetical protein
VEHKLELFLIAFVAALVVVPLVSYVYDYIAKTVAPATLPQV